MQKATAGGILAIVSSILGALTGLFLLAVPALLGPMNNVDTSGLLTQGDVDQIITVLYGGLGAFFILLGALGLVGGIFAVNHRKFGLALAGAIASSISFYPLGIVAVVLISMSHADFHRSAAQAAPPVTPSI
jgi:hypothetical protein